MENCILFHRKIRLSQDRGLVNHSNADDADFSPWFLYVKVAFHGSGLEMTIKASVRTALIWHVLLRGGRVSEYNQ